MKNYTYPALLSALFILMTIRAEAQPGCPDPQASNYNASATSNDGSCLYPPTGYAPAFKCHLNNDLPEISGLTLGNGVWWGHNDSGYNEEFYHVDPQTCDVSQKVKLDNAHNKDWEDIAADAQQLYVGDFGNNDNDRHNLGIYLVPFSEIGNSNSETVHEFEWSFLPFSYADQTDYTTVSEDSSVFDCEAMIVKNGKIHLFTKTRRNYNTVHYIVNPSSNTAEKVESFDSQGLITGAGLSPDGKLIALVGYDLRPFIPTVFCWLLWDWPAGTDQFFSGNKRRIELGSALQVGQVESVGFATNRSGYISNEVTTFNGVTIVEQSVWAVDFSTWVPESVGTHAPVWQDPGARIFPNPFAQELQFQFNTEEKPDMLRIKNQLGQNVLTLTDIPEKLDLSALPSGLYVFECWKNGAQAGVLKAIKE